MNTTEKNTLIRAFLNKNEITVIVPFSYTLGEAFPYSGEICTLENVVDEVRTEWEEQNVIGSDAEMNIIDFHNDWNLLMEVVNKITSSDSFHNNYPNNSAFWDAYTTIDKESVLDACIEFIKWDSGTSTIYPFSEGDDYFTIEDGKIVKSCWDDISEELHDENPNKRYYATQEDAESGLSALGYVNNGKLRKGIVVETASLCYCNNCEKTMIDKNPSNQIELPIPIDAKELVLIKEDEDFFWVCPYCQSDENLIDLG